MTLLLRRLAAIAALAALASGCVAHGALKRELYPQAPAASKSSARVVVVRQPGPPAKLVHRELPLSRAELDLSGYPDAAAAMLSTLYERVFLATTSAEAENADFIVSLDSGYPGVVGLSFADRSGKTLASFSRPGVDVPDDPDASSALIKIMLPPAAVVSFGAIGIGLMQRALQARDRIEADVSSATARALEQLRAEIAASPELLPAPAAAAPWKSSPTCTAALSDLQAPPEVHLSCADAAQGGRAWAQAAAHLKAYLAARGDAPDAPKLRERLSGLESRR